MSWVCIGLGAVIGGLTAYGGVMALAWWYGHKWRWR